LGVVPSPQTVAQFASRRAINLAANQATEPRPFLTAPRIKVERALFKEIATLATERVMADFSCALTKRMSHWSAPMSWEVPVRFRVSVVVAALVLTGCNANQAINVTGQSGRCANDPSCNPYNPSSYAQNNTGNAGGGGGR
jgi:hypothetical protein